VRQYCRVTTIVVTRPVHEDALALLRPRADVVVGPVEPPIPTAAEVAQLARDADVLFTLPASPTNADVIRGASRLRMIATLGTGYDNIDVAAARERGIPVTYAPGILDETTADVAFGLLLAAARRFGEAERFLRAGKFRVALDELLRESDFVSLHVPSSPETRHLIDAGALGLMKRTAILVNTARGPVVDEHALAEALRDGVIAGAGIDVFEREPQVDPLLMQQENAVLLPHIASGSERTRRRMAIRAAENILAFLDGKPLLDPVP